MRIGGLWSELSAYARQARLMHRGLTRPRVRSAADDPDVAAPGDDRVILVHGLLATADVLDPLRVHLEGDRRCRTAAVSYGPGAGFEAIEAKVRALVASMPSDVRIHLVGHSLGGVVARYVAVVDPDPRVVQTISLAAPFGGVAAGGLLPVLGGFAGLAGLAALAPDGPVLRRLRGASWSDGAVPHLSIIASDDALVRPPIAHALPGGEVAVLPGRGHNALLFDEDAHRRVVSAVRRRRD